MVILSDARYAVPDTGSFIYIKACFFFLLKKDGIEGAIWVFEYSVDFECLDQISLGMCRDIKLVMYIRTRSLCMCVRGPTLCNPCALPPIFFVHDVPAGFAVWPSGLFTQLHFRQENKIIHMHHSLRSQSLLRQLVTAALCLLWAQ